MANCLKGECSDELGNCSPCAECDDCPDPVLPKCDVTLTPNGVFTNATIVIEEGCIREVRNGEPFIYDPVTCCAEPGTGGGGGDGLDGPPGPPGQNATIRIGSVATVAPNQQARVENTGTLTAAVLDFFIPQGQPGEDSPDADGVTNSQGGWIIEDGLIKALPPVWPPLAGVVAVSVTPGASLGAETNETTGMVTITFDMSGYDTAIRAYVLDQIAQVALPIQEEILALQQRATDLETRMTAAEGRLTANEAELADHETRIAALESATP